MRKIIPLLLILALTLSGCLNPPVEPAPSGSIPVSTPTVNDDDMFNEDDKTEPAPTGIAINLNGSSASCSSNKVSISDSTVTIKSSGTYVISGTLNNGSVVVNAQKTDEVNVILYGANITCQDNAPIRVLQAKKVILTLSGGTENTITNGGHFPTGGEIIIDGALFSKQDLTINGTGKLNILSPAGHGIVCKDNLVITGGTFAIQSGSHGIDANDSFRFTNATMEINCEKDGVHVENIEDTSLGFSYISSGTIIINAMGDGISASSFSQISSCTLQLTTGGGSKNGKNHPSQGAPGRPGLFQTADTDDTSTKGIKSGTDLTILSGEITIDSADDALHANNSLLVSGGNIQISAGDDACHADQNLTISGGMMNINQSYEGLEAIHVVISGGNVKLTAQDDGINAAGGNDESGGGGMDGGMFPGRPGKPGNSGSSSSKGSVTISGGTLYIKASGDGIDANGTLSITGGHTVVCGPTQGDTATLDFDNSGIITGGTFIGTGASGMMAQTFSGYENQSVLSVSVSNQQAGTKITLKDSAGNIILTHEPELSFAVVILSCPEIQSGQTYTLTVGSLSKEFTAS